MDNKTLTPAEIAIASFGGVRKLARALNRDPAAVSRWQKSALVPSAAQKPMLEAAWSRLFVPAGPAGDEHDIVVCHGNVIRWFTARVLNNAPENWLEASIANCSVTVVQVRADGSTKLIAFADSGHLPWGMTTYPGVTVEQ